ncbi:hypothetical protein CBR_g21203 [Chara braunii]|uniref:Uncharacterized protein n=1 Tax=Chara braunii TaxID=69332 RepID=A0A388L100_CHABU|nr:hypothetical protein CBR_g21203 [Chara braunii]|eukprot:GBG75961.1 hypothetical protein CBR_g21203 [Chara braunii]
MWSHVYRSFSRSKPLAACSWSARRSPVSCSSLSASSRLVHTSSTNPRHLYCKCRGLKLDCLVKLMSEASSCSWKTRRSVGQLQRYPRTVSAAAAASDDEAPSDHSGNAPTRGADVDNDDLSSQKFIIIEGRDTVEDFAKLQLQEIAENITRRRNKIFLLMEEVRRLRIQQRLRKAENRINGHSDSEEEDDMQEYPSSIPLLPPLTMNDLKLYYLTYFSLVALVIVFGGIFAPMLELKLGLGGTSYAEFIHSMHLPDQLSQVDPIVASFSGGALGVISALMVVEVNNVKVQEKKKCKYCSGTGYLTCGRCSGSGTVLEAEATSVLASGGDTKRTTTSVINPSVQARCSYCSGVGKVMCTSCLCTGRAMATEHDLRIDPFV